VLGSQQAFDGDPAAAAAAVSANYTGAVSSGLAVADRFRRQGHGRLVVLSSVAGERVRKANFVYGSSKAGLDGFAQGLGDALEGTGASVLVVRPGFVASSMTEGMERAPFATTPEAVADAVAHGLAKRRRTVWVPGILRVVFAVFRHLPGPVWRRLPI
jgi:decaprenylphospho-beta-D-erythro-pentofuranosid-2-ulose 2-reductase